MEDWSVLDLAGDPVPGDPARIQTLAARLLREAEYAEQHASRLHQVAANADLRMQGDFAPLFQQRLARLPQQAAGLGPAHESCGRALVAYVRTLEQAKIQSRAALSRGMQADAQYKAALQQFCTLVPGFWYTGNWRGLDEPFALRYTQNLRPEVRAAAARIGAYAARAEQERQAAATMVRQAARLAAEAEMRCAQAIRAAIPTRKEHNNRSATSDRVVVAAGLVGGSVGSLRFKEASEGMTVGLRDSYRTPKTPELAASVNPRDGKQNCRGCAVAVDKRLSGEGIAVAFPQLERGPLTPLERVYGRTFRDMSFPWIVRSMKKAGDGARGIVYGSDVEGGHVFNVVNLSGEVIFLDGQVGHVRHLLTWESYKLMRTN